MNAADKLAERKARAALHAKLYSVAVEKKVNTPVTKPVTMNQFQRYEQQAALLEKARERERVRQSNYLAHKAEEELATIIQTNNIESSKKPINITRFIKKHSFKINTKYVILEAFNPYFKEIDTRQDTDFILLNIKSLSFAVVVDSIKKNKDAIILIYSEAINSHKYNFDNIKENMFRGYQTMVKDLLAKPNGPRAAELRVKIDSIKKERDALFSRMFLMSVQKNGGFDFPLINPILLFISSIIHGHKKMSDIECRLYDPELKEADPLKRIIISQDGDDGEAVARFMYQNFVVKKRKIFFLSNEFYYPSQGEKPSRQKQELLCILSYLSTEELNIAFEEKRVISEADDEHRAAYLSDRAKMYKGTAKILIDIFEDETKTKVFDCSKVNPIGYKLCHNIINYVDYLAEEFNFKQDNSEESLFRFFEVVPPAYLFTRPAPHDYNNHVIYGYLEKHPNEIDQDWFNNDLTYAQTNRLLDQMVSKKIELYKVFDDMYNAFPKICESIRVGGEPKVGENVVESNLYIFLGDKLSGKTFIAKKFVEYLDSKVPEEEETNATIIGEFKKKLNMCIQDYSEIVIDAKTMNHEYNRRMLKKFLKNEIKVASQINFCFININILDSFKNMLIKYTKSEYPTTFTPNTSPKGYYQRNIKGTNVIDMTNCFWIDASKDAADFVFEISRQIH